MAADEILGRLDVAREKEDVVGGQLELRADRRDGVAAALHGGQEEAVQRTQPGCLDCFAHHWRGAADLQADQQLLVLLRRGHRPALAPLLRGRQQPGREDEHVEDAEDHVGHTVYGDVKHAEDGDVRIDLRSLSLKPGNDQIGGGADERACAAEDGGIGERDEQLLGVDAGRGFGPRKDERHQQRHDRRVVQKRGEHRHRERHPHLRHQQRAGLAQ
mmetsp:Transcript_1987/g.5009  ORF Transcript_1987/g.5009 Transcript_1987/m.5009 type:complete len:216 (-) Transcript_1987:517-1164(-)